MAGGPLDDITVIEVANWIAAPSCGALLADMGARVVKVEPLTGDTMRNKLRQPVLPEGAISTDFPFHLDNRGKRSLAVDLTSPEGAALVRELAVKADVFVTNLLPGRLQRFGLDAARLHATNVGLVYAMVTGYGSRGEEADRIGFDLTAYFARSGIMAMIGEPDAPPPSFRPGQGDHPTALALLAAVLAALRVRDRTGAGQVVETALLRTATWSIGCDVAVALVDRRRPSRRSRSDAMSPLNTTYRCADGVWLNLAALDQGQWGRFCGVLGRPELATDERFVSPTDRFANRHEIISILEAEFAAQPSSHWIPRLQQSGLIWGAVHNVDELVDDPQARANAMFETIVDPVAGPFETLAAPFVMSASRVAARGPAPTTGQDSSTILRELGLTDHRIADLLVRGVIGDGRSPSA